MVHVTHHTRIMSLILGALLREVETNLSAQDIANALPSREIVRKSLHETAAEIVTLVRMKSSGVKNHFACDRANKRGAHHMIKHVSFCDLTNERLVACELDSDACVSPNEKVAAAIDLVVNNLDLSRPSESKLIINGFSANEGGGKAGVGLERDLSSLDTLDPPSSFGVARCLHGHSLSFKSPVEKEFMLGSVIKRTVLHILRVPCVLEQ